MKQTVFHKILTWIMILALCFGYLPPLHLHAHAAEDANHLTGKTISILGASISTYAGVSNGAAADTSNSTIRNNAKYYPHSVVTDVKLEDTWWMQAVEDLGLRLLVNNSWSGSSLLHERNGTVGAYIERCLQLHDDTGANAGEEPDIIAIQMGTNDFQYFKETLGTADIDYDQLIRTNSDGTYTYAQPSTTLEAAAIMLNKIHARYPNAELYYLNISQRIDGTDDLIRSFNAELASVCEHFGVTIVDIYGSAITMEDFDTYIGDNRVHPNRLGMDAYTEAFKRAVIANTKYEVETHTVRFALDGVTADYGDDKIVVSGDSFQVQLSTDDDMEVKVTLGGKDITASAYANGSVQIPSVTDDVVISAKAVKSDGHFLWEFDQNDLVCVDGNNGLTRVAGTVSDGIFSNVAYSLGKKVELLHNEPWIVEWRSEGTFRNSESSSGGRIFTSSFVNADYGARYLFKSANSWIIAMGEKSKSGSHNYGVALADHGIDGSAPHTYRLENRIASDGSNMVYLFVDGQEIGPMNGYYVGTTYQNTTSDWISGKDFSFYYMGTDNHGLSNCSLEYVEVYEAGKSAATAEFFAGKTISILGDSISTFSGVSNDASVNATLKGSSVYYSSGTLGVSRSDTWWQQAIDLLDMELLVNNSWGGSTILHTRSGTAGAYLDRCVQLHNDKTGEEPDVIAIFMGTNDVSYYQSKLGTSNIDYNALIQNNGNGAFTYATPTTSCEAYAIMLHKISVRYPDAEVYCMTMLPRRAEDYAGDSVTDVPTPTAFNQELAKVIRHFGATVVDLENCGITSDISNFDTYITDKRVHPGPLGMDKITGALVSAMLGRETGVCTVTRNLVNVTASSAAGMILSGASYQTTLTPAAGFDHLNVKVTMGGKDITDSALSGNIIQISNVTGNVVITASATIDDEPDNYYWEIDGNNFINVAPVEKGYSTNAVTKKGGSISGGVMSSAYFQLEKPVVLRHDRPWVVEWTVSGTSWSGMLLSGSATSNTTGNSFLFKTTQNTGFIGFGEPSGGSYHNYGIALEKLGVNTNEEHYYRIENRIADDGTNMAYLMVDGQDCGPMDNFFIGGNSDQGKKVSWLSGRDFYFSYIGSSGHALNNCQLKYLAVFENGEPDTEIKLRYDDRYDVTGRTVEILDAGTPTSYQVGYGVAENSVKDTAVVTLSGDKLIATGIGTALVKIDGVTYNVEVTAAPISLLLLAGQSNMQGSEGDENQSIVCPDGMVYSTYGDRYTMTTSNATNFVPSALAGEGSEINVNGTTENLSEWPIYLLNEKGVGKKGPDSGFGYEWVQQTGEKVWVVNAAHGGTSLNLWQPGKSEYEECQALFTAVTETLRKEIAAGHFTLSHMAYFWCQGCSDASWTAEAYVKKYLTLHESFKSELAFDHDSDPATADKTFEFGGIIPVRAGHNSYVSYREGANSDTTTAAYHESFKDLRFTGSRVAQYWMGNNPELEDIWLVCNAGEDWVWMPDGTNGVTAYFQKHYPNGTVDYTTQVKQSASWYTPTTPKDVHDSIHYNQIGYNEVGRESVRNALIMLGELPDYSEKTTVRLVDWTGYKTVSGISASTVGQSSTLVVPIVSPITRSKDVTYQVSDGLNYRYYDLTVDSYGINGTLTAVGAKGTVAVTSRALSAYRWEWSGDKLVSVGENENAMTRIQGTTQNGVLIDSQYRMEEPIVLLHDESWILEWKMTGPWYDDASTTSKKIFCEDGSSATSGAMCLLVNGKTNRISIGYYGTTTHESYGIDLSDYGISVADTHVYRLANHIDSTGKNTVYLFVDGRQLGVMTRYFTGSGGDMGKDSDWLSGKDIAFGYMGTPSYLLDNGTIEYVSVIETGASGNVHFHDWTQWQTVAAAGPNGPGKEKRTCACGQVEERTINSIWQTTNLAQYFQELPENTCSGLNLWSVLRHDPVYYVNSSGDWGYHSSKNVPSITIPVSPGDKIFATSFGKAKENGHASSNGIRVTFFDINGVVKTTDPAGTYAEFQANGGYLIAPEGAIAVNIPLWNNNDDNEIYILNKEHTYVGGKCSCCGLQGSSIPSDWYPVPISVTETSEHLAYQIKDGILTFHDFGDPANDDYGRLPNYTNNSDTTMRYTITPWYQAKDTIQEVVFDSTISYVGSYVMTNMDKVQKIRLEAPNVTVARDAVLFSTTNRAAGLSIYAPTTMTSCDYWIRGNGNRKITEAISSVTLYYTDKSSLAAELKPLKDALDSGKKVDGALLCYALQAVKEIPRNSYTISNYTCQLLGAEGLLNYIWEIFSGTCGNGVTYTLNAIEGSDSLCLEISGKGSLDNFATVSAPWHEIRDNISQVIIGEYITGFTGAGFPENAVYYLTLNSESYPVAKQKGLNVKLNNLRVLVIGNSHTVDYSEFLSLIRNDLANCGLETEISVTRATIGSIGLYSGRNSNVNATHRSHLAAIQAKTGAYSNLTKYRYDLIIVQDYMESVVDTPDVFAEGLSAFIGTISALIAESGNGTPEIAWFADWVDYRTTGAENALYDGNGNRISLEKLSREQVYQKSLACISKIENEIARNTQNMPDFVIHGSTIKQNAMSSYLGTSKIADKQNYCLLERDTTHLSYELGRYLMAAGVMSEIIDHYQPVLAKSKGDVTVASALTLQNTPDVYGNDAQCTGSVNQEILAIIREAISSPNQFQQSAYTVDPVDRIEAQIRALSWNIPANGDKSAVLSSIKTQIEKAVGSEADALTIEMAQFDSVNDFTIKVILSKGYTIRTVTLIFHTHT